MFDLIFSSSYH